MWKEIRGALGWIGALAAAILVWVSQEAIGDIAEKIFGPRIEPMILWLSSNLVAVVIFWLFLWGAYRVGRHERSIEPTFLLERIQYSGTSTRNSEDYSLVVRNKGEPFADNIVKLMEVRSALTGDSHFTERLPMALRTQARSEDDEGNSRFNLGANEPKQVLLCSLFHGDPGIVLVAERNHTFSLHENDSDGFIATVGLYGRTGKEYDLHVKQAGRRLKITIMDEKSMVALGAKWEAKRQANQQARRFPPASKDGQKPQPPSGV